MLQYDPEKRITAEEAIQHKYFEEIHDPDDIQLFKGKIDFDFEKDKDITLEKIKLYIIKEVNFFRKQYKQTPLDERALLKKWRTYELTAPMKALDGKK